MASATSLISKLRPLSGGGGGVGKRTVGQASDWKWKLVSKRQQRHLLGRVSLGK
jgi:hypothetical protein